MNTKALDLLNQLQDTWAHTTIKSEVLTALSINDALENPHRLNEAHQAVREGTQQIKTLFDDLQRELKRQSFTADQEMLDIPDFLRRHND